MFVLYLESSSWYLNGHFTYLGKWARLDILKVRLDILTGICQDISSINLIVVVLWKPVYRVSFYGECQFCILKVRLDIRTGISLNLLNKLVFMSRKFVLTFWRALWVPPKIYINSSYGYLESSSRYPNFNVSFKPFRMVRWSSIVCPLYFHICVYY